MSTFHEWLSMREGLMGFPKFGQSGDNIQARRQAMIASHQKANLGKKEELEKAKKLKELEARKAAYASRGVSK